MATKRTLISEVSIYAPEGVLRSRDVPVRVEPLVRGRTLITIERRTDGLNDVTLLLSGAERIALIEALGGHV
jgi:hypothetical protein